MTVVGALGEMDFTVRESDRDSGHFVAEGSEVLFTASVEEETVRELRDRCGAPSLPVRTPTDMPAHFDYT